MDFITPTGELYSPYNHTTCFDDSDPITTVSVAVYGSVAAKEQGDSPVRFEQFHIDRINSDKDALAQVSDGLAALPEFDGFKQVETVVKGVPERQQGQPG